MHRLFIALLALFIVAGCRNAEPESLPGTAISARPARRLATIAPAAMPPLPPSPTSTPTAMPTPTPTFTPTPTALPLRVAGDPRALSLATPSPQTGAPCGLVDLLDFPLDPPDAAEVSRGGRDFGVFRRRYDGYHTGEDWWGIRGRSSFGEPVYAIGHGRVTYADPLGWGRDKGTVVVEHIFPDGRQILSFYGHLDPPSVILDVGDCLARGDQVGQIGKPRTPPHLHFEVRTHMPGGPGTGYWSVDPTLAGWLPPSQTIWDSRISSAPGVRWLRPASTAGSDIVGLVNGDTLVLGEDDRLVGISLENGQLRWNHQPSSAIPFDQVEEALLDASRPLLYLADQLGQVEALALSQPPEDGGETLFEPLWMLDLDAVGFPTLLPLPGGGVILSVWDRLFAISQEGRVLWEADSVARPFDWIVVDDSLIFSTEGSERSLWTAKSSGLVPWQVPLGGHLVSLDDRLLLFDENGLYRLNPETTSAELLVELPQSRLRSGDAAALPDGGLLVVHVDRFDRRLIALDADGSLRWQRSFADVVQGELNILVHGAGLYLVSQDIQNSSSEVSIFAVDVDQAELTHLFTGGTRSPITDRTEVMGVGDDLILINIGGGSSVAFDPQLAEEALAQATENRSGAVE